MTDSYAWLITAASLVGTVANIKKRRWCFWVWLFSNLAWTIYDWQIGAFAQSALQAIYAALSVWGLISWKVNP